MNWDEQLEQNQYIHIMDIHHNQVLTSSQTEPERNPTLSPLPSADPALPHTDFPEKEIKRT